MLIVHVGLEGRVKERRVEEEEEEARVFVIGAEWISLNLTRKLGSDLSVT